MSRLYPHIAKRDSEDQVFAYWLRSLNDRNFHFSQWKEAAFKEPARCASHSLVTLHCNICSVHEVKSHPPSPSVLLSPLEIGGWIPLFLRTRRSLTSFNL